MIERTVVLEYPAETTDQGFAVERWFLPVDGPAESLVRVALVFGTHVVLCSKQRAHQISAAIRDLADSIDD